MHHIIQEDLETIVDGLQEEVKTLEGKTLLISGGAGFLGSYFVGTIHLLNKKFTKPCRVIVVDNYITGSKDSFINELLDENIRLIEADVTKPFAVDEPVHFIIHAAGLASPVYYRKFPLETIDVAVMGTKNLLELAREKQVQSYLGFSSSEIYGNPDPNFVPTPETYRGNVSCTGPRSCYDESKRLAETMSLTYHQIYAVPIKIVRPFNIYGPGMKHNDYRVIPTFMMRAMAGEMLPVHDTGNQTRTFCYISDAITGFLKVLLSDKNGEIYNVGIDGPEVNMLALATMITDIFPHKASIQTVQYPDSYPADEPNRRCPDLTKIRAYLNYNPKVDLKDGLERTLAWYKDVVSPGAKLV